MLPVLALLAAAARAGGFRFWRVSNGGPMDWRPGVAELRLFSDSSCTAPLALPPEGGWDEEASACHYTGCSLCSGSPRASFHHET